MEGEGREGRRGRRAKVEREGDGKGEEGAKRGEQFLAHVYCGQMAGFIKMPLGTEVNLGPGDVVLDGVAAPPNGAQPPVFGSCLVWPNNWMDEDATWYKGRPWPRPHCVRRCQLPRERGTAAPSFRRMSIVAMVAHLSYC